MDGIAESRAFVFYAPEEPEDDIEDRIDTRKRESRREAKSGSSVKGSESPQVHVSERRNTFLISLPPFVHSRESIFCKVARRIGNTRSLSVERGVHHTMTAIITHFT